MAPTNEELVQRYQSGDENAIEELIKQCDKELKQFANKCCNKCNRKDLYQEFYAEASIALFESAKKYDLQNKSENGKTALFLTFAYAKMQWAAMKVARENNTVIFSSYALNKYSKVCHEFKKHSELPRDEAIKATALALKMKEKAVIECLESASLLYTDSLEDSAFEDGDGDIKSRVTEDRIQDAEHDLLQKDQRRQLEEQLLTLSPREEQVLRRRFGFDDGEEQSVETIAEEMGISVENVNEIERRAFKRLRKPGRADQLKGKDGQ